MSNFWKLDVQILVLMLLYMNWCECSYDLLSNVLVVCNAISTHTLSTSHTDLRIIFFFKFFYFLIWTWELFCAMVYAICICYMRYYFLCDRCLYATIIQDNTSASTYALHHNYTNLSFIRKINLTYN